MFHYADTSIGRHYGFLVVDILPGDGDTWTASFRQAWIDPAAANDPAVDPLGGYYDEVDPAAYFQAVAEVPDADADGEPDRLPRHRALASGLNLIAQTVPVDPALASCRALAQRLAQTAEAVSIQRIAADGALQGCSGTTGDDFALEADMGLAVRITDAAGLSQSWQGDCRPIMLHAGTNLVGHPAPPLDLTCRGWLAAQHPDSVVAIGSLDAGTGRWRYCASASGDDGVPILVGPDFPIAHGLAYRIHARAAGSLVLPGCDD